MQVTTSIKMMKKPTVYFKNMSFKEIAETTNVSINTALGRMRYAILNMRRIAEERNITLTI